MARRRAVVVQADDGSGTSSDEEEFAYAAEVDPPLPFTSDDGTGTNSEEVDGVESVPSTSGPQTPGQRSGNKISIKLGASTLPCHVRALDGYV